MFSGSEDRLWLIHLADGAVRRYRRAFLQENRFDCLVGGSYSSRALQRVGFFRGLEATPTKARGGVRLWPVCRGRDWRAV
jgi:hypothetical protein